MSITAILVVLALAFIAFGVHELQSKLESGYYQRHFND